MQASTVSVKGSIFGAKNQKGLVGFGEFRNGSGLRPKRVCMSKNSNFCGSRLSSVAVGSGMSSARVSLGGVLANSVKSRSVRVQASGLHTIAYCFYQFFWIAFDGDV